MENLILNIKVFLFVFAALSIIRDAYGLAKIIALQEGKYDLTNNRLLLLGVTLSYVITIIIMGF